MTAIGEVLDVLRRVVRPDSWDTPEALQRDAALALDRWERERDAEEKARARMDREVNGPRSLRY